MQIMAEQSAQLNQSAVDLGARQGMGQGLFQGNGNRYNANTWQQNVGIMPEMLMAMNGIKSKHQT
jgi:hypothetical protein